MSSIIPVILSGGAGTRLWPLSREMHPKQFLPLISENSLIQNTLNRLNQFINNPPIVLCNEHHRFMVAEQLRQIECNNATIVLEPESRNTAPAITLAALIAEQEYSNAILLVLPSDHFIEDQDLFLQTIYAAKLLAFENHILTLGIKPHKPETSYGYIKVSEQLSESCGYKIGKFIEKPDLPTAQNFFNSGEYFWNSGIFIFQPKTYLNEVKKYAPDIFKNCKAAMQRAVKDLDFIRPAADSFMKCQNISIDYAVMEKTTIGALVPLETKWSDLGSWDKLWKISPKTDKNFNVLKGDVITHNVKNSYIYAHSRMISAVGIENCIIIETGDAVLIIHQDHCQDLTKIVQHLKLNKRTELETHLKVFRPWGSYELLASEEKFQVKHLIVNPKASLSLQTHQHRSEHWVVVKGTAKITQNNQISILTENQSTYIPIGMKHRLENPDLTPLEVIEIQSGNYLGEDDIIRFDDHYKR